MRFRQIHLDFHTSEKVPQVGADFVPEQFQAMLKLGHVDSITIFSKCHHGWSYHPTTVGRQHPTLKFDLLGAQIKAAHAIDVKVPVYLSAGLDEQNYWRHPEWSRRMIDGSVPWTGNNANAGYHEMCLNTGYLDLLLAEIDEVCRNYDADGIFLDIVSPRTCFCNKCMTDRIAEDNDPRDEKAANEHGRRVYLNYTRKVRATIDASKPGLRVFHNGGHIPRGDRELAHENTHLELESLPTGGWSYDHFPLSAAGARPLGMEFLGMTGKFHESWGEFGGFKHPNALRYEAALCAAHGSRMSIGDQLHPRAKMEEATYALIGAAYAELEAKEPWLVGARGLAEVAVLTVEAAGSASAGVGQMPHGSKADEGVSRVLNEGRIPFDAIDVDANLAQYRLLILPDGIRLGGRLLEVVKAFIKRGGKLFVTGTSGFALDRDEQQFDFGATDGGVTGMDPDYLVPAFAVPPWRSTAFVVYGQGRNLQVTTGTTLVRRDPPYFNRDLLHFCSHRHTPNSFTNGGAAMVAGPAGTWCSFPAFSIYTERGQQVLRDILLHGNRRELGVQLIEASLPASGGRVTVTRQDTKKRDIVHLLFALQSKRGQGIEVIEDIVPLHNVAVTLRRAAKPSGVVLAPQGGEVPFTYADGLVRFTVPTVECHQMVVVAD